MTKNFTILGSLALTLTAITGVACGGGEVETNTTGGAAAGTAGSSNGKAGSGGTAAGAAGAAGKAGSGGAGAAGASGSAGNAGKAGTAGASGSAGKAGNGGASGAAGKAGNGGASGAAGKAGSGGASGASGAAGKAGAGGASGAAGAAGKAGNGGASGTAGASGAAGNAGAAGTAGASGTAGSAGSAPNCNDNVKNQDETDVDCGGALCGTCADGQGCVVGTDCKSTNCDGTTKKCVPAVSCTNATKDGAETDVDCGGGTCKTCPTGNGCAVGADCDSGVCDAATGKCLDASCTDLVRNGAETDTDCGGGTCKTCDVGGGCKVGTDCSSGTCDPVTNLCVAAPSCVDLVKNGTETDVDCGGGSCPLCTTGQGCTQGSDCDSTLCDGTTNKCLPSPTCFDVVKNQDETGVDCGGATCAKRCDTGEPCVVGGDCASGVCDAGTNTCAAPACPDTVQNGAETDIDCGGPACKQCTVGQKCLIGTDCDSAICDAGTGTCAPGQCGDGILSAGEGCDLGAANNSTVPAFVYFQGTTRFSPIPFTGASTAAGLYSYGNPNGSSGNTGNEATDTCFMYLYRQTTTGVLSLIMHCGKKSAQAAAKANLDCTGVASASVVTVSDDNNELTKPAATTLRGRWNFNANTDGGVLSGVDFPGTNATMTCTWSGLTGLPNGVFWLNADGSKTQVTQGSSFDLTINAVGSTCRTNCTAPKCNDGVLDAGEMCDDGDPVGGACPANCLFP